MEGQSWLNLLEFFGAVAVIFLVPRLIGNFFAWLAVRKIQRQTKAIEKLNETTERLIRDISDKH